MGHTDTAQRRRPRKNPMDYDYQDYWANLHARGGLSAVGQSSMSEHINNWIYRTRARNLRRFVRAHGLDKGGRVLEVGVGTGFWLPMWKSFGYQVDGCDLIEEAAARVQEAHPDGRFWQADLSSDKG